MLRYGGFDSIRLFCGGLKTPRRNPGLFYGANLEKRDYSGIKRPAIKKGINRQSENPL
jgi:hypothetical protein